MTRLVRTRPARAMTVLQPGPFSTVQDLGRPGLACMGIGASGAADRRSLQWANRLVGNDDGAAAVEMTMGRLRLRFDVDAVVAVTGAPCEFSVGTAAGRMDTARSVAAGEEFRARAPIIGLRTYLAVRGGVDVPPVLGSRSTDTLAGLGPPVLTPGMVLPLGEPAPGCDTRAAETVDQHGPVHLDRNTPLTLIPGPRDDWFTADALASMYAAQWTVTTAANRIGVRLAGPALGRRILAELPPEPMVAGAVQVPPGGPILFLADHPVTGGYPVIGVLPREHLHRAAQLRPGQDVRFVRGGVH